MVGGREGKVVEASSGADGGANAVVDGAEVVAGGVDGGAEEKVKAGGGNSKASKRAAKKTKGKKQQEEADKVVAEGKTSEDKTSVEPIIQVLPPTPAFIEETPIVEQPDDTNVRSTPESNEAENFHYISQTPEPVAENVVNADGAPANTMPVTELSSVESTPTDAVEEASHPEQLVDGPEAKQVDPAHPSTSSLINLDETLPVFGDSEPASSAAPTRESVVDTRETYTNDPEPSSPGTPAATTGQIHSQHTSDTFGSTKAHSDASIHEQTPTGADGVTEQTSIEPGRSVTAKRLRPQLTGTSMASEQATVYEDAESAHGGENEATTIEA